jgi:hypothetical protein
MSARSVRALQLATEHWLTENRKTVCAIRPGES